MGQIIATTTGFDPASVATDAAGDLLGYVGTVAPVAVGVGVAILGVQFCYRLVRKFAK